MLLTSDDPIVRKTTAGLVLITATGTVNREVLRTDRRGRRYLRFTIGGRRRSLRCYWFVPPGTSTDGVRHGQRYTVEGEPRWFRDETVLLIRRISEPNPATVANDSLIGPANPTSRPNPCLRTDRNRSLARVLRLVRPGATDKEP